MSTVRDEITDVLCDVVAESYAAACGSELEQTMFGLAVDRIATILRDALIDDDADLYERNVIDARLHEVGLVEGTA